MKIGDLPVDVATDTDSQNGFELIGLWVSVLKLLPVFKEIY